MKIEIGVKLRARNLIPMLFQLHAQSIGKERMKVFSSIEKCIENSLNFMYNKDESYSFC